MWGLKKKKKFPFLGERRVLVILRGADGVDYIRYLSRPNDVREGMLLSGGFVVTSKQTVFHEKSTFAPATRNKWIILRNWEELPVGRRAAMAAMKGLPQ